MKDLVGLDFFAKVLCPSALKARDDRLYFIGKRANLDRNAYDSDLYCYHDGQVRQLTASHDIGSYALREDGIVFASTREQKDKDAAKDGAPLTVYQRLPYDGGEAQEVLRLPYAVNDAKWLPDGTLLFGATYDHTLQSFLDAFDGDAEKARKAKKEQDDALTVVDELPFWFNGRGFINKTREALYYFDGTDTKMLSDPYTDVDKIVVSEDGTRAIFSQVYFESIIPRESTLHMLDIATGAIRRVESVPACSIEDYAFGPDDTALVLCTSDDMPHGISVSNPKLCIAPLSGGEMRVLDEGDLYNYADTIGSDVRLGIADNGLTARGSIVSFLSTQVNDCHLFQYDVETGTFTQVTQTPGAVMEHIPYGDGYAILAMRENGLGDIYTVSLDGTETQCTHLNDALLDAHEIVTPIPLSFTNKEGTEIHGWVMPPVDYVPGKVYPAILDIHGGPKTAYGSVFFHEMQYWCAQGFAVLFCNPTGGDGRGSAFADIRGKYGSVDYEDIMQFVDEAITRFGFISAVRMGVTGGSYGGFMTNWIIGHTDRFRAAASQRSISNWLGFANTSDIGRFFGEDQMQGTPWSAPEKLWDMSPIKYADQVKTPTLFIHSEEDYRCNMFEGLQMYYALRVHGVESRLCLFKGENHELSRSGKPKNRIRRLQEITRWMEKYLTYLET